MLGADNPDLEFLGGPFKWGYYKLSLEVAGQDTGVLLSRSRRARSAGRDRPAAPPSSFASVLPSLLPSAANKKQKKTKAFGPPALLFS